METLSKDLELARKNVLSMAKSLESLQVVDSQTLSVANTWAVDLRTVEKKIDEYWDPLIEKAKEAKKKAEESRKGLSDEKERMKEGIQKARKMVEGKIAEYIRVEEEKRKVEAEKARKEAQKQEDDMRLDLAVEAESSGNEQLADSILEGSAHVPTTAVAPPSVKEELHGINTFEHWYAEIINEHQVVQAWLDGKTPITVVTVNLGELSKFAKLQKERFDVPGAIAKKEIRIKGAR